MSRQLRQLRQLIIAGMHRSGTSLLASVAIRAGVDMGARLMAGSKGNPHGHFEDLDLVAFHDSLLESRGWSPLRAPAEPLVLTADEERRAGELVTARSAQPLWGFKDPRATLVLEVWQRLLPDAFFILVYRHPVEVVLSLLRRGLDLEVQLDPRVAMRAWESYNARLLALHAAAPERSSLWHIAAAASDLNGAFEQLGRKMGVPLATTNLDTPLVAEDLHVGLAAPDIDWTAVVPEALRIYRQLEAGAALPSAAVGHSTFMRQDRSTFERELQETAERLLAGALASAGSDGDSGPLVLSPARAVYSELRLACARLESRTHQLESELAVATEQLRKVESTQAQIVGTAGFRLLDAYWSANRRARAWDRRVRERLWRLRGRPRPRPEDVLIGCVTEANPKFLDQTLRLVQSIRWFGGSLARSRILVCMVEADDPAGRRAMERYDAEVRVVPRTDPRNGSANKLQFLAAGLQSGAALLLLLDCDMVVVRDPLPLLETGRLQSKIADVPSVRHQDFERLFPHFGLPVPKRRYRTTFLDEPTICYCNTGFVAMPSDDSLFFEAWRDYNSRILEVLELLDTSAHHCHQASFSLAIAARPVPFREAPLALNFPLHLTHLEPPRAMLRSDPAILHYHSLVDAEGYLLPSPYPLAQARIEAFNRRRREESAAP